MRRPARDESCALNKLKPRNCLRAPARRAIKILTFLGNGDIIGFGRKSGSPRRFFTESYNIKNGELVDRLRGSCELRPLYLMRIMPP